MRSPVDIRYRTAFGLAAVLGAMTLTVVLASCNTEEDREVRATCANAPDVQKCEDAEYNRRAAADWARFNAGREYP
jgi:hypothetical protein